MPYIWTPSISPRKIDVAITGFSKHELLNCCQSLFGESLSPHYVQCLAQLGPSSQRFFSRLAPALSASAAQGGRLDGEAGSRGPVGGQSAEQRRLRTGRRGGESEGEGGAGEESGLGLE